MATIPSYRTWVAGEVVTAAYFNSNVRDAGNFLLSWPVCEARQTIAQTLANITYSALLYDTNDIDTDGAHSTSVNISRYVAKTAGRFQLGGGCGFLNNATGRRVLVWAKNGTQLNGSEVGAQTITSGNITEVGSRPGFTTFLNGTTDYVELLAYQDSTGALNTAVTTVSQPNLSVRMVGTI